MPGAGATGTRRGCAFWGGGAADQRRRVHSAQACPDGPAAVQPAVADCACVENAIAEGRGNDALSQHAADEQSPADARELHLRPASNVGKPLAHLVDEPRYGALMHNTVLGNS